MMKLFDNRRGSSPPKAKRHRQVYRYFVKSHRLAKLKGIGKVRQCPKLNCIGAMQLQIRK